MQAASSETAEGYPTHQEWVASPAAQQVVGAINRAVEDRFGNPDQVTARDQLARGLVGTALDHTTQTVVVVVDPDRVDQNQLRQRLQRVAADGHSQSGGRLPELRVDVRAGCSSAEDLLRAESVLSSRSWHPRAATASYPYYLDASDSRYRVAFGEKDRAVAEALRQALGHRVTVTIAPTPGSAVQATGRLDDPPPHWGGAGIHAPGDESLLCTSGFTVVQNGPAGKAGSVTAGHCFGPGVPISSGSHDYGVVATSFNDASRDMAFITSTPAHPTTYDHFIYVDPGPPDVRNVVGRSDPPLNSSVCISGVITRAKCGITVTSLSGGTACDATACTTGLAIGSRPGVVIAQPGDSGAPIYLRTANDGAIIRGMNIGAPAGFPPTGFIAFHRVTQIEAGLGVTVSTG